MQLASGTTSEKNDAKRRLKTAYLEEFMKHDDYSTSELQPLLNIGQLAGRWLA
jgi:hypothetical protein